MRLITHNMLQCHVKGCNANNFPLELQEVVLEQEEAEMNEDFLRNMLTKIEYEALVATCLKVHITLRRREKIISTKVVDIYAQEMGPIN